MAPLAWSSDHNTKNNTKNTKKNTQTQHTGLDVISSQVQVPVFQQVSARVLEIKALETSELLLRQETQRTNYSCPEHFTNGLSRRNFDTCHAKYCAAHAALCCTPKPHRASTMPSSEMDAYAKLKVGDCHTSASQRCQFVQVPLYELLLTCLPVGVQVVKQCRNVVHCLRPAFIHSKHE